MTNSPTVPSETRGSPMNDRTALSTIALLMITAGAILFIFLWGSQLACWIAIGVMSLGLALATRYFVVSWRTYTAVDIGDTVGMRSDKDLEAEIESVLVRVDALNSMTPLAAVRFLYLLAFPDKAFDRMSDSAEPLTRSLSLTTTGSLKVQGREGEVVVVPLLMRYRGTLEDGLRFFDGSGDRISSLTHVETSAYCLAVVRTIIRSWNPSIELFYRREAEKRLAEIIYRDEVLEKDGITETINFVAALAPKYVHEESVDNLKQFISALQSRQPLCIAVPLDRNSHLFREVSHEDRNEPISPSEVDRPAEAAGNSPPSDAPNAAQGASSMAPETFTLRLSARRRTVVEFNYNLRGRANSHAQRKGRRSLVDLIRTAFGIRATLISVPLINAGRAASYHLDVLGPEGTYLARQWTALEEDPAATLPGKVVAQPRSGQRHAHLYVKGASQTELYVYSAQFYERMPGSMAPAFASSFSLAVLVWLGITALVPSGNELFRNWEYAGLVLAFPSAISIWLGVDSGRRLSEGVLAARVITLVTVVLAIASAWLSIDFSRTAFLPYWYVVATLATLNMGSAGLSWFVRARLLSKFIGQSTEQIHRAVDRTNVR